MIESKINYNDLIIELIKKFIKDDIINIIRYVNYKYPKLFTKKDTKKYIKKYKNITFCNYSQFKINKLSIKVRKKLVKRRFKNAKSLNNINKQNKDILSYHKNDKYCNARTWNGGSILNLPDGKTLYGGRCTRHKLKDKEYCYQHCIKNKHENYFTEISQKLKEHFEKFNK